MKHLQLMSEIMMKDQMLSSYDKEQGKDVCSQHLFFFFFLCFLGPHLWHMEIPRLIRAVAAKPTPEPQQCRIRATSATYTTAYGNARSLTH